MALSKKTPSKPNVKKIEAKSKPAATYKPVGEATPRYVAPVEATAPKAAPTNAATPDESWELSARFWWATFWRSAVILLPLNLVLQYLFVLGMGGGEEPSESMGLLVLLSMVVANVLVQVAVLRYMLRKKHFKGFTFTLTRR